MGYDFTRKDYEAIRKMDRNQMEKYVKKFYDQGVKDTTKAAAKDVTNEQQEGQA